MTPAPPARLAWPALALFLLAAASAPLGQEPQQPAPAPTFRTKVDLVRVDVSVIGRDDEPIADLQAADFLVEEDGVPQTVETLQFVRLDGTRTSDLEESLDIRSPEHAALEAARDDVRLFAIFLDDYHVDKQPQITLPLRQALTTFVEQFGPNDLIAVMDPLTPLSHLRFTRSRAELVERMQDFEGRRGQLFPVKSVLEEAQLTQRNVWELRGGVSLSALGALVTHLGGLREGRKSVLFVSQGPSLGPLGSSNHERLREVVQAANRANVTIHALDPRPLGSSPLGGADAINRLTHETGGRAIVNTNAPGERLPGVIADASAYYLLGYTPPREPADGKFHRIEVKVKRRGLRVVARRGYWAPTAEELTADEGAPVDPALVKTLADLVAPVDGRAAEVWVGASHGPGTATRLIVSWEPAVERGGPRPVTLTVERVEPDGTAAADTQSIMAAGARDGTAMAIFDVAGGADATLRFSALDASGAVVDRWSQTVPVPQHRGDDLVLSTPRFFRARSAFEARQLGAAGATPAASRRFRPSDRVIVDVEYSTAAGVPAFAATLHNARGEHLVDLAVPAPAEGKTRLILPIASLAPSTYVLRIEARDGEQLVRQQSAFKVIP